MRAYDGPVLGSQSKAHIVLRENFDVVVDVEGGQTTFRDLLGCEAEDAGRELASALALLEERGVLFRKHEFRDAVAMKPEVNAGQPTVRNTSLETRFVEALVRSTSVSEVARLYRVGEQYVRRATEFERAA